MKLTTAQQDRVVGVLLGTACGDALGAGYEFGPPLGDDVEVEMTGGGTFRWAPGEWTDDTSMAVAIAEAAADGLDLRSAEAQDRIVARWLDWSLDATDVGDVVTFDGDCNPTVHADRIGFDTADIVSYVGFDNYNFHSAAWHTVELADGRYVSFGHDSGCGTDCCFNYDVTVADTVLAGI